MKLRNIDFDISEGIALATLNRPKKLNALNDEVIAELGQVAQRIGSDPEVDGAILTGAGEKAFAAGADIAELARQGPFDGKARALKGQQVYRALETCGKPVIAAVNGFALGGGCELAMACHLRTASENAKFGQPEVSLGITPGYGGTQRLPRLVGKGRALDLILTGRIVGAEEAERMGLVNRIFPAADLLDETRKLLESILGMGPRALELAIEAVDRGLEMSLEEGLMLEANHFGLLASSDDMKEGMSAFLEKRKANFSGK